MIDFFKKKQIIGMVHLLPLPGSPKYSNNDSEIRKRAFQDAEALIDGGIDSIIVENFNDDPYAEIIDNFGFALMVSICTELKNKYNDSYYSQSIELD